MKKTIIALVALTGLSVAADDVVNIDFGRQTTTTDGYYNVFVDDGQDFAWNANVPVYVHGATSATSSHQLLLGEQNITMTYVHSTGQERVSGMGLCPTLTPSEESDWKNPFRAKLPTGVTGNVADGLTTQTNSEAGGGKHILTFSGLTAGTYTLTAFGGYYGKEGMSDITVGLGGDITANWNSMTYGSDSWGASASTSSASSITLSGNTSTSTINRGYYFSADQIVVGEDGILELTIHGTNTGANNNGKYRTPLNYVSLSLVPEPTTATLSLLALAGLAARRRRK
ncbi:MAG: PEP-CTERM sorting domain-containing protein [Bacteroidaceae bacterium]|nr:PEP-CTERM sorting domain-containing protein [Bacteroidaceae bacterium]